MNLCIKKVFDYKIIIDYIKVKTFKPKSEQRKTNVQVLNTFLQTMDMVITLDEY